MKNILFCLAMSTQVAESQLRQLKLFLFPNYLLLTKETFSKTQFPLIEIRIEGKRSTFFSLATVCPVSVPFLAHQWNSNLFVATCSNLSNRRELLSLALGLSELVQETHQTVSKLIDGIQRVTKLIDSIIYEYERFQSLCL